MSPGVPTVPPDREAVAALLWADVDYKKAVRIFRLTPETDPSLVCHHRNAALVAWTTIERARWALSGVQQPSPQPSF